MKLDCSYEDFPDYTEPVEGMREIPVSMDDLEFFCYPDVEYVRRPQGARVLQIFVPQKIIYNGEQFPLIVFIQGSAWFKQWIEKRMPMQGHFATRGFAFALVQYRESELAPFPAQIEDAKTAIRFMRKHAEEYRIDPDNIFLWGDSSGAHTALMAGMTQETGEFDTEDYSEFSCKVNAIVDNYGPSDLTRMHIPPSSMEHTDPDSPQGMLLGGVPVLENLDKAAAASPVNFVRPDVSIPPILMFHGTKDMTVPFEQSVLLYKKLKKMGKDVTFYAIRGGDHGGPTFWSDRVMDVIEAFLRAYMV